MSSAVSSVAVAGIDLPIADEMKVIGRSSAHIWQTRCDGSTSCNYHALAIRHKRHLLTTELAQMFTCSLILSRLDYCNTVLYGALMTTINKLQRVQNNAGRTVLQMPKRTHAKPLLEKLHWLPVKQCISYKTAVLTFKVRSMSTLTYLNHHIQTRQRARDTGLSGFQRCSSCSPGWKCSNWTLLLLRHAWPRYRHGLWLSHRRHCG